MRVRVDSQGRPWPKTPSNPPQPSAEADTSCSSGTSDTQSDPEHSHQLNPVSAEPKVPVKPPFPPASSCEHAKRATSSTRDVTKPAIHSSSLPKPSRPPTTPRVPAPNVKTPSKNPVADDSSDSGSTATTEGYNSEDEHPLRVETPEVPMRTLREREDEFAAQLAAKSLRIVEMCPDGNCLFRALAHSVWNDQERHAAVRASVMQYLVQERDYFSQFVSEDFVRYVRRKSREGTHGNHLELQAAAELFGRPIEVFSYAATPSTIIDSWGASPDPSTAPEPIRLSFHRGNHYNAILPVNRPEKSAKQFADAAHLEQWHGPPETIAVQEELERAVMALSLVEATRGDAAAGSASSSSAVVPSAVLALVNSGYPEERAFDAYRIAGHGGLSEMIRYLSCTSRHAGAPPTLPRRRKRVRTLQVRGERPSASGTRAASPCPSAERKDSSPSNRSRRQEQPLSRAERSRDGQGVRRP